MCTNVLVSGWVCFGGGSSCGVIYLEFLVTFTVVNGIFSFGQLFFHMTMDWKDCTRNDLQFSVSLIIGNPFPY